MAGRLPRFYHLAELIAARITTGEFPAGAQLPSERVLGAEFHHSRVAVRKALAELEARGVLKRDDNRRMLVIGAAAGDIPANPGSDMVFVTTLDRTAQLDIYRMLYEELLHLCNMRGIRLFYADVSHPLPSFLLEATFQAAFVARDIGTNAAIKSLLKPLLKPQTRVIAFDDCQQNADYCVISADHYQGGCLAAQRLYERGCRNMLFVGVRSAYVYAPFTDRKNGFINQLAEYGLPVRCFDMENPRSREDYDVLESYLREHGGDGIFVFNDNLAFGVLKLLAGMGIAVPQEIAVVSLDGLEIGPLASPALTSVAQPVRAMAETAFRMATRPEKPAPEVIRIPCTLIGRDSA